MERNTHKITIGLPNHIIEHLDLNDFNLYMKKAIPRMSLFNTLVELQSSHLCRHIRRLPKFNPTPNR